MSQINIPFNGTDYPVDKSALSSATDALKTHLSTVMNGSGAVINLDGTSYNVDSTKLTNATNTFASHLGTIGGSGSKVVINGVEYSLDSAKMNDAIADLHEIFNSIKTEAKEIAAGLYESGTNYGTMISSWDELVESGAIVVDNGVLYRGNVAPDNLPAVNEYGFYFDVPYNDGWGYEVVFHADGSYEYYGYDELEYEMPAGSAVYSQNQADMSSVGDMVAVFADEKNMSWHDYNYALGRPADYVGDLVLIDDGSITSIGEIQYDDDGGGYTIVRKAFEDCVNLTGILIPNSVTTISPQAFYNCTSLTNASFGDNNQLTEIGNEMSVGGIGVGNNAFDNCTSLTNVTFGGNSRLTSIGENAFSRCASLTNVTFGSNSKITSIGVYAFDQCTSLTNVTFGKNSQLTEIGEYAFYYCGGLTEIEFPSSIASIGKRAFHYCTSLTSITFGDNSQLTEIGTEAFFGCDNLQSVTFGKNSQLTEIGASAFRYCGGLTEIEIPSNISNFTIGKSTFRDCGFINLKIPYGVTHIGSSAFYDCGSLISIEIPKTVTSIDDQSFYECNNLTIITILAETPPTANSPIPGNHPALTAIKVPASSVDAYKAARYWSNYADIIVAI